MAAFALPTNLVDSVRADPLPERCDWPPTLLVTWPGGGRCGWGRRFSPAGDAPGWRPARTASGQDLVLKVAWRHDEAVHEADGLRVWAGHDSTSVLLLERCHPGTTLAARPEPEQDEVVAGLLTQLWTAPVDGIGFRPLQVMREAWAAQFQMIRATGEA